MKIRKLAQWALINLCLITSTLTAQHGQIVHGTDLGERCLSATLIPWSGTTALAGNFPTSTSSFGLLFEEKPVPFASVGFSNRYFVSGSNYQLTAVCADPATQTFLTAGIATQANGKVFTFFHRLNSTGQVLNTWQLSSKDRITITSLSLASDGKFLMGGKSETTSPQQSFAFAAKVQFLPFLLIDWHHQFVTPALTSGAQDHTVAIMEKSDGTYIVGGNTHFQSNTSLIVPFIAHLDTAGALLTYHHIQGTGLSVLLARDMILHPNGDVYMTGMTNNGTSGIDVFLLRINSSLTIVTFGQYRPSPTNSLTEGGVSLVFNETASKVYIAGFATQQNPSTHLDGLMIVTDLATNLQGVRTYGGNAHDQFTDLVAVPGVGFHAIGSTLSFSPAGLLNENTFSVRMSAQLNSGCNEANPSYVRITAPGFAMNSITPNDQPSGTFGSVTSRRLAAFFNTQILCQGLQPRLAPQPEPESMQTQLFPNPASGSTTLRIPSLETAAQIQIIDLQGRILQSMTTQASEVELDLEGLPQGIYLVRMVADGLTTTHRLVVE